MGLLADTQEEDRTPQCTTEGRLVALGVIQHLAPFGLLGIFVGQSEILVMALKKKKSSSERILGISLPNGEVSGAREFGCSGCEGRSAGGGAKEEIKFLGVEDYCLLGHGAGCTCMACSAGEVLAPAGYSHCFLQQALRASSTLLSPVWGTQGGLTRSFSVGIFIMICVASECTESMLAL